MYLFSWTLLDDLAIESQLAYNLNLFFSNINLVSASFYLREKCKFNDGENETLLFYFLSLKIHLPKLKSIFHTTVVLFLISRVVELQ